LKALVFLLLSTLTALASFGQTIKYSDIDSVRKGKFKTYISKDGAVYNVGDTLTVGVPTSKRIFVFITYGDSEPITPLEAIHTSLKTPIKKIWVTGTKKRGYMVVFRTKGVRATLTYSIQVEDALLSGELNSFATTDD
jgi:hypothetical protein